MLNLHRLCLSSAPGLATAPGRLAERGALIAFAVTILTSSLFAEVPVHFEYVEERARAISGQPYAAPLPDLPAALKELNYDQFRWIGFRDGKELYAETLRPFRIGFYHRGHVHVDRVDVNVIHQRSSQRIPFSKDYFHYLNAAGDLEIPDDLGFAGFRVKGAFPGHADLEEIFSFVGSSYFRAKAFRSELGTSARGLAVNCGLPEPEEFPVFTEYWIVEPQLGDKSLKIYALLNSISVAGAYEFLLTPGIEKTDIDVRQRLYFRQVPEKVGIAPMSSMWLWGDGLAGPSADHRPEVHDADGLQIQTKEGKWHWRALSQQNYPSIVRFKFDGLKGFGLLQRDNYPNHYLDNEAKYDVRPSLWVQPLSDWGPGSIELLEIPAPHEGIDNIAAWWVPDAPVIPGSPIEFNYRLSYFRGDCPEHTLGKAIAHRVTHADSGLVKVEIDFDGPGLAALPQEKNLQLEVIPVRGKVTSRTLKKRPSGCWTASLAVQPTEQSPVELRVTIFDEIQELTEIWTYLCPLTPPPVSTP